MAGLARPKKDKNSDSSATNESYDVRGSEFSIGPTYMLTGDLHSDGAYIAGGVGSTKTEVRNYSDLKLKGALESPYVRTTAGYQWVFSNNMRILVGGGFQFLTGDKEVVIKDQAGNVFLREDASSTGGLALDAQFGLSF